MLTLNDRNKIGNAVVYIASHVRGRLSKTKLLKLLYLMEEYSVGHFKTPFLGLQFEVWQAGPVVKDLFVDLSQTSVILSDFITKRIEGDFTYISPKVEFCDDEFSDNDMMVMDEVLSVYGAKSASDLVTRTHREGGLWYKKSKENNLLSSFLNKSCNTSDVIIDFSEMLSDRNLEFYNNQLEFLKLTRNL